MEKLSYKGNNPGAVKYGNFINYYQFHPTENRLKSLPVNIWNNFTNTIICLDIGCNAGDLTIAMHEYLRKNVKQNCEILAIDIDPILIQRAKQKNKLKQIQFEELDFTHETKRNILLKNYFKKFNVDKFDIIFCFSVTMWIHLNNGDEGLIKFLRDICNISKMLVIEPQPWKCYRSAVKRLKLCNEEFSYFKNLKLKNAEQSINNIILKQGFLKVEETKMCEWGRKIYFFKDVINSFRN